jgi:hypothetical protein
MPNRREQPIEGRSESDENLASRTGGGMNRGRALQLLVRTLQRCRQALRDRRGDLALGIERIGFLSLKFPVVVSCVVAVLTVAAAFGVPRIRIDDSLSQLFRSDTPEFKQYQLEAHRFPSSAFDVLSMENRCCNDIRSAGCEIWSPICNSWTAHAARFRCSPHASRRQAMRRRHRSFPTNCRRALPTSNWSDGSGRTRSSGASCCRRTVVSP